MEKKIQIVPNPNGNNFLYHLYLSSLTQTYNKTFNIIPNPRSSGFVYQKSEYIMRKTFEFLPDFFETKIN